MIRKALTLIVIVAVAALLWLLETRAPNVYVRKGFLTAATLAGLYLLFKIVIEEFLARGIKDAKTKYSLRKTFSIIYVAVALQDFFKNFAGGIIIFVTGIYRVGDRIEISSTYGDVIDIGIMYTTLMELRQWVDGDQETGRLTIIPNGYVLSGHVSNYNKDNNYVWDELMIPITYDSDWRAAERLILEIARCETEQTAAYAQKEIAKLGDKYYLFQRSTEAAVFLVMTDNWISFHIRYVADFKERRIRRNRLMRLLLEGIEKADNIKIASATYDIVGFPELTLKGKE